VGIGGETPFDLKLNSNLSARKFKSENTLIEIIG
jgi:hypothetical protein